jgi:ion channel-forming bestrophin family protein
MIVRKRLKWTIILRNAWPLLLLWCAVSAIAYTLYFKLGIKHIALPFAPIGVLGTALSIFLGFRNSSSYDRWWEARKIWGGIVNSSRNFSRQVLTLADSNNVAENKNRQREFIYRHLAWINALRFQLRGQTNTPQWNEELGKFLSTEELQQLQSAKNKATQLMLTQGKAIAIAARAGMFDDFRHMQLDNTLSEFYNLQGACERIKNTPLPRQYDFFNFLFLHAFLTILPFGLLEIFQKSALPALLIPLTMLCGFVFYIVEGVGRRNEDPFENKITDTPMTALCRTIEIDLRQMLDEENIPEKAEPQDGFLF